ncbi:substrate-binding domain-containing protein [Salisediminibacterium selenitireducens]|uniref:Extracellular solute-binding protein n=1 Tax=Bacillus selenitireducens (strain ATCC 700615 / DSM 15326 / MLS10) TaxID=439292 RepID=D6XZC6_BACIE|nr:substrate-binding domain-containing protein [Salisediminibacterium selenitireducens]ADI00411.1 extracellular solute-binding protein [[Bacillus] selenitireducens MLS10]
MKTKIGLFILLGMATALPAACSNEGESDQQESPDEDPAEELSQDDSSGDWRADIGGNMILATTTSTYDSGLLDGLIPVFEDGTGVNVQIISVGTGATLEMGERGEADALLTHAPEAEQELEDAGHVINRHQVMHNDFVIVGPVDDPAETAGLSVDEAFANIYEGEHLFYTRGDNSGTHMQELAIWEMAGIEPGYDNYEETGQGMADTLRIGAERGGYALTDRGTYLSLEEELDTLDILVEGDGILLNIYHVMQVDPDHSDQINADAAEAFVIFLMDEEIQEMIAEFGVDQYGQPLFFRRE